MPWNQPGSGGNKDPWGGGGGRQSPPDLDDIVKNVQKNLSGLLAASAAAAGARAALPAGVVHPIK